MALLIVDFSMWTKLLDLLRQFRGPGVGPITTYSYKYIVLSFIVVVPLVEHQTIKTNIQTFFKINNVSIVAENDLNESTS